MKFRSSKLTAALLAALTTLTLTVSAAPAAFAEDPIIPPAEDTVVLPSGNFIVVDEEAEMPAISSGEQKTLEIPLQNVHGTIRDIQIEVSLPDGVSLTGASKRILIDRIRRNEELLLPLSVVASADAPSGIHTVALNLTFTYYGMQVTETVECNMAVNGTGTAAGSVQVYSYEIAGSGTAAAGGAFELLLTLKNDSDAAIENGSIRLGGLATGGFTANGETDVKTFTVGANSTAVVRYKLLADRSMTAGSYPLTVTTTSALGENSANIYLPVKGVAGSADGAGDSTPLIVIESYDYGGESVLGGSTFTLTMNIKNTSTVTAMENIKLTVASEAGSSGQGGAFTPASSSNTFYIARIGAGQTVTQTIDLMTRTDAAPDSYGINANFSYEAVIDAQRRTITAEETITIPVTQPDRFTLTEASTWGPIYVGDTAYVSVNYVNKGKTTIYNLSVRAEGTNFTTAESESYIGNVDSGNGDYFELEYSPMEAGTVEGTLIFTYEDANGNQKEVSKTFTNDVMSYEDMWGGEPDIPVDVMPEIPEEKAFPWLWVGIGAGVVLVAVVVVIIIKKKKKAKALADLDEDDED